MHDVLLGLLAWVALAVAVAAAWSAIATTIKRRSPVKVPAPRDTGERPEGRHVGYRWRTNPPGSWWPGGNASEPDDSEKVQPGRWRRATREQR